MTAVTAKSPLDCKYITPLQEISSGQSVNRDIEPITYVHRLPYFISRET